MPKVNEMYLCCECDEVFESAANRRGDVPRCPACMASAVFPLNRWVMSMAAVADQADRMGLRKEAAHVE